MPKQPHSSSRGFTLLEVLIAIVVLSFGLLGLAGIQAVGIKNTYDANARTLAIQQAYDMADRIRANTIGASAGAYDNITTTIPGDPGCITSTSGCSATQLRDYDQRYWNTNNQNMLRLGRGTVAVVGGTAIPNKQYLITVMWDEARTGATGTGCSTNLTTDLSCFQLTFRP
ncbi:MAG: type IV pilus modification protein PilV [Hydrogenophilales bacterium]|nr:type IV pilus modification protein PilV [Hydrogenophilales bacterium]